MSDHFSTIIHAPPSAGSAHTLCGPLQPGTCRPAPVDHRTAQRQKQHATSVQAPVHALLARVAVCVQSRSVRCSWARPAWHRSRRLPTSNQSARGRHIGDAIVCPRIQGMYGASAVQNDVLTEYIFASCHDCQRLLGLGARDDAASSAHSQVEQQTAVNSTHDACLTGSTEDRRPSAWRGHSTQRCSGCTCQRTAWVEWARQTSVRSLKNLRSANSPTRPRS